jgi:predicted Zn-dependent protease with MMP-like domain
MKSRQAHRITTTRISDKISIFRGPITRLAAGDTDRLRREVRHVVLRELAHHFGVK